MATIDRSYTGPIIIKEPVDPIDPTWCPTCLSGTGPTDPYYEEVIKQPVGVVG